jgi:signal transduction histidine kinase
VRGHAIKLCASRRRDHRINARNACGKPRNPLRADPDRLAQALRNLLANAIADAHGGRVAAAQAASDAGGARITLELPRFAPAGAGLGSSPQAIRVD